MKENYSIYSKLKELLVRIDEEFGGDIDFFPPVPQEKIKEFEKVTGWELPDIFKYFYSQETNGLLVDDKRILGFYDKDCKKTWVENLERYNNPETSPWFKGRAEIFKNYLIIGVDQNLLFCLSKKYSFPNPLIYVTDNANSISGVNFERLDLDLYHLVTSVLQQAF
ncbi:MAG: SMI1/KNR4 family protein [Alphaproteobacteria bacterium]